MVRDYRYDNGRDQRPKEPTLLDKAWEAVLILLSIIAAIALACALLAPHIEPSKSWLLPIFGLLIPVIYVANSLIALYWIMKWRLKIASPTIVLLAIGFYSISLFYNPQLSKSYETKTRGKTLKVMSYNVRGFLNDDSWWSTSDIAEYINVESPDIVALQEVNSNTGHFPKSFEMALKSYNKLYHGKMAIYSRYPIVNDKDLLAKRDDKSGQAIYADINIKGDTIRLFNIHLQSTTIKSSDDKYLTSKAVIRDTNRQYKVRNIINRYRKSAVNRSAQANIITAATLASPYEVILCGDFNDTPMSYSYQTISQGLTDGFTICGSGYPYTYRGFYNTLRIDYILSSIRYKPISYKIDTEQTYSDHYPVIVEFERQKN